MSRSGEKHAQDYNLMWCILMALRVIYFPAVIYGDPVCHSSLPRPRSAVQWRHDTHGLMGEQVGVAVVI